MNKKVTFDEFSVIIFALAAERVGYYVSWTDERGKINVALFARPAKTVCLSMHGDATGGYFFSIRTNAIHANDVNYAEIIERQAKDARWLAEKAFELGNTVECFPFTPVHQA